MNEILALQAIGVEEEEAAFPTITTVTTTTSLWSTLSNGCSGFSVGCKAA